MAEKTEAIVIRLADFSESSRVVSFFTREFGKISALAKGGRRLKGPFDAALDLLTRSRIVFLPKSSGSLHLLTEAQLLKRFVPRREDITSLYGGYYVAELLNSLLEEGDPFPVVFEAAVTALAELSQQGSPQTALLRFELILLRELGHLPGFEECLKCRTPLDAETAPLVLWVSQGGLLCARCRQEKYERNVIHAGTLAILRRLSDPADVLGKRLSISPDQEKELRFLVTSLVTHLLGRRPRMTRYLQL